MKRTVVLTVILVMIVAMVAMFRGGNASVVGGDIGVNQTQSLTEGTLEPDLA